MNSASKEDEDEETEDFLNRSEQLLDLHAQGYDIAENMKNLKLPKAPTEGMNFIYSELKKLTEQPSESFGSSPVRTPSPRPEQFRPISPSHRCKCVHVVLPKKNDGLQAEDFAYLMLFAIISLIVYLYLYSPDYRNRQPIY